MSRKVSLADLDPKFLERNLADIARQANPEAAPEIATKAKRVSKMTRIEMEYEAILRRENPAAAILFERYTLKLANDCRYTPDFAVIRKVEMVNLHPYWQIEFHEVKGAYLFAGATGSATHASLTKPKLAAQNYPWHRFFRATKAKDGTWSREELKATP